MRTRQGGCGCRAVRYEVDGSSSWCAHSHQTSLRRMVGAPMVTLIGVRTTKFQVLLGEELLVDAPLDGGSIRFCRQCGTHLYQASPEWFHQVHILAATLDDGPKRQPSGHLYWEEKAAWLAVADDLPRFGGDHGSTPLGVMSADERINAAHPNVRIAAEWDAPDLTEMYERLAATEAGKTPAGMGTHLRSYLSQSRRGWILIAERDGVPLGFADVKLMPAVAEGATQIFIDDLWVDEGARRQGLGTALLQVVDVCAELSGAVLCFLLSRPDNDPGSALYRAAGFEQQHHSLWKKSVAVT
jgi:ribosomal protein S18 acetylase RimI-like enzyme